MNRKLLITDMDGTLVDTAEANFRAYRKAADQLGYDISEKKFLKVFAGKSYKEFLPEFGIISSEEQEKVHELKKGCYQDFLKYLRLNNELVKVLKQGKAEGNVVALATTASEKNTQDVLKNFGLDKFFDIIITQEDVKNIKPSPDCYNIIMQRAGIPPADTIIYEDSETGIEAAKRSGAVLVVVSIGTENVCDRVIRCDKDNV